MKVVIMAGGKGTRIASIANDIPKPMISINGKTILEYEIQNLKDQGYHEIILVVGHLGHIIQDYFKDGSKFGVNIKYFKEETPLGTAGALYYLKDELTEDFFLLNGDAVMDIDFNRMEKYHREKNASVTLFTHPNNHPYDSALIVTDNFGKVIKWIHKEEKRELYKNRVNAGIHILSPRVIAEIKHPGKWDLDRDILKPLVDNGDVYAYDSPEYVKDMGTPERLNEVTLDLANGKVTAKCLRKEQKAIFLDRDGTINKYKGFITKPDQIELIDGVAEAIKHINSSNYLVIVISNQPVIARGDCTFEELNSINNMIETQLGNYGAYVDSWFICPHHPDKGFEGERIEYKIKCNCRKPKPGLILDAIDKFNILPEESYMIGDSKSDIIAGYKAKCNPIYIGDNKIDDLDFKFETYANLKEFVEKKIN